MQGNQELDHLKWNTAMFNVINYSCAFPAMTCRNVCCETCVLCNPSSGVLKVDGVFLGSLQAADRPTVSQLHPILHANFEQVLNI